MIIGCDIIKSLGIDIHGGDMNIHWDYSTIPWRDIDSTAKDVFALLQHNAPFNSETKRMKRILDAKYSKADIKLSQKATLILILKKEMSGAFCDRFYIGFRIFSIEDTFHSFCFSIERAYMVPHLV